MQTRAAVAWEAGKPLTIETIEIEGPKAGDLAKPSTAAINQPTPPTINNNTTTNKK